ncbi:MAG: helix-hairpin-helix domain-containing protein [Aliarcobacter sp.]|nr:helix-hairpin-helix domain-containing protein [Aliarcobacter sp.]
MIKIIGILMLFVSFIFASINLQTATKNELMSIKGVGDKKADQIIEYRKTNEIKSAEDLKNIKGFGNSIVSNVKKMNETPKKELVKNSKEKVTKTSSQTTK